MTQVGNHLLAGAAFARNQLRDVARGHSLHGANHGVHGLALDNGRRAAAQEATAANTAEQGQRIGREISGELNRSALETPDPARPVTLDMISSAHNYAQRADLIRNFVKQDPDRAALVVRDLLKEGKKENA